jgi:hypothetical protein
LLGNLIWPYQAGDVIQTYEYPLLRRSQELVSRHNNLMGCIVTTTEHQDLIQVLSQQLPLPILEEVLTHVAAFSVVDDESHHGLVVLSGE